MKYKFIELRDRATFIPIIAFKMAGGSNPEGESYLKRRLGYNSDTVFLFSPTKREVEENSFSWEDRTFTTAHRELEDNWDKYESGDVLDVEFILSETKEPKKSERLTDKYY